MSICPNSTLAYHCKHHFSKCLLLNSNNHTLLRKHIRHQSMAAFIFFVWHISRSVSVNQNNGHNRQSVLLSSKGVENLMPGPPMYASLVVHTAEIISATEFNQGQCHKWQYIPPSSPAHTRKETASVHVGMQMWSWWEQNVMMVETYQKKEKRRKNNKMLTTCCNPSDCHSRRPPSLPDHCYRR